MKKQLLIFTIFILFSNLLYSQDVLTSQTEIEKVIASHLYDSVTVKGRVICPIYKENDPSITPLDDAIIDIYYLRTFYKNFTYKNRDKAVVLSQNSDIDGCFEFKLARGRYVIVIYTYKLETELQKIYLSIGDKEINDGVINLDDIRLEAYTLCFSYD
ncbi:MAG: hypothetical protein R3Y51_02330 [Rikenellaceae bacterium]